MTVKELIEKLQMLNSNDEVVIEANHDEFIPLKAERVVEDLITPDYRLSAASRQWFRPAQEDVNARNVVVIRA